MAERQGDSIAYFDRQAATYDTWVNDPGDAYHERIRIFDALIRRCYETAPVPRAIDLGCGSGEFTRRLVDAGFEVTGIDGAEEMLERARARLGARAVDLRRQPLPLNEEVMKELRGTAGLVLSSSVIEYLEDDLQFIKQCRELLAPGGSALVSFANAQSLYRKYERALGARGPQRGTIVEVQCRQHSRRDVETLARQANLRLAEVIYFNISPDRLRHRLRMRPWWLATILLARLERSA